LFCAWTVVPAFYPAFAFLERQGLQFWRGIEEKELKGKCYSSELIFIDYLF
jgi:hypothetical protein